ncbi:MAG: hypothetical protein EAZ24_08240 [Burkholderiales bacterium]|nr:MAG: hypothetical protein EAZ24_08240 [Burkholderiales bacterium]
MKKLIQVLKVNDARSGTKNDRAWTMQDAECVILNDDRSVAQVGVLQLPRDLVGEKAPTPGMYEAVFELRASITNRRIEAVVVSLLPAKSTSVQGTPQPLK